MRVLGIETSCDETGIAVFQENTGILSENVYSQVDLHAQYGGVVPELASRDHIQKTLPLIRQTLAEGNLNLEDLDGIAYTVGPGLVGALMIGASIGSSLAWGLGIPGIAIHHMEAHLLATLLAPSQPKFPFVALLVSGGHTMLVNVVEFDQYELLGESLDDAAGEAYDKTAKLLNIGYPGGPEIEKLAKQGNSDQFSFPRPMTDRPGLDFSFSGLKTAVQTCVREQEPVSPQVQANIAHAFQEAVVDTLVIKCRRALKQTGSSQLILAGGVAANQRLRERMTELDANVYYPSMSLCTDNGAMIAFAGYERLRRGMKSGLSVNCRARWPLTEIDM